MCQTLSSKSKEKLKQIDNYGDHQGQMRKESMAAAIT